MNEFEDIWIPITTEEMQIRFSGVTESGIQRLIDKGIFVRRYNEKLQCYEYQLRDQRLLDAIHDSIACGEGEVMSQFLLREIDIYDRMN